MAKKKYCDQRKFWGEEVCQECVNKWPSCNNILKSKFVKFEKALEAWSLSRSRKEYCELYDKLRDSISDQLHDCHWDRVFIIAGKLSEKFPETKAERKESEKFWDSLPEYQPLPAKPDEVLATFLKKKS